jgi:DICT domain-containing protein
MRAEEFRTKADNSEFPQTRETLRQVANNYEELAQRAEQVVTLAELDEAFQRRSAG